MFFHGLILARVPRPGPITTHGSTGWPLGHDVPWRIHWWSHRLGLPWKQRLCTVLVPIFSRHVQPWIAGYVPGFGFSSAGDISGKHSHTMVASNGLGPAQLKDLMIHLSYSHWFRILIGFIVKLPGLARQSCEPWKVMPYWFWSVKKLFESAALRGRHEIFQGEMGESMSHMDMVTFCSDKRMSFWRSVMRAHLDACGGPSLSKVFVIHVLVDMIYWTLIVTFRVVTAVLS